MSNAQWLATIGAPPCGAALLGPTALLLLLLLALLLLLLATAELAVAVVAPFALAALAALEPELDEVTDSLESVRSVFWRSCEWRSLMVQMYLALPAESRNWMPFFSSAAWSAALRADEVGGAGADMATAG
jgi:hypothetical protein